VRCEQIKGSVFKNLNPEDWPNLKEVRIRGTKIRKEDMKSLEDSGVTIEF